MYYYTVLAEVYDSGNQFVGFADTCVRASCNDEAAVLGWKALRAEADSVGNNCNLAVVYAEPAKFGPDALTQNTAQWDDDLLF